MAQILVADGDPAIRELLTVALRSEGHEVRTAPDGRTAVRKLEVLRADCVVLDVMMPSLDGYVVLRRIRAQDSEPVPVIMLSAEAEPDTAVRAWREGIDFFVTKPFGPDAVLDLIDTLLGDDLRHADA